MGHGATQQRDMLILIFFIKYIYWVQSSMLQEAPQCEDVLQILQLLEVASLYSAQRCLNATTDL
jgi:hypothetical protein